MAARAWTSSSGARIGQAGANGDARYSFADGARFLLALLAIISV
jgi:hypothetical protein